MLLSLTKEQVELLRFAVQNARAELANSLRNGDVPYDDIKYGVYNRKCYLLDVIDDYLFDILHK